MQQPIRIPRPADDDTLPAFAALTAAHIVIPVDAAALASAIGELRACPCVGFDTESRPSAKTNGAKAWAKRAGTISSPWRRP